MVRAVEERTGFMRRFIQQLGDQESVREIFRIGEVQLRTNRNGNLYLQCELSDRTGRIPTRLWNATESTAQGFDNGDYVYVEGTTQLFQGSMQIIATRITRTDASKVDEEDFLQVARRDIDRLASKAADLLRSICDPSLANLAECFLQDQELWTRFTLAPAGVKLHHAYPGGLLEHSVQLMEMAAAISGNYPEADRDQLVLGAFLHDLGKTGELRWDHELAYTDEGQLLGHVVLGLEILESKIRETNAFTGEAFPPDLRLRLRHLLVAHHGEQEFGSPRIPMTLEAMILYCLDTMDAKVGAFTQQMRDDPGAGAWTAYNTNLGRRLFKSDFFTKRQD